MTPAINVDYPNTARFLSKRPNFMRALKEKQIHIQHLYDMEFPQLEIEGIPEAREILQQCADLRINGDVGQRKYLLCIQLKSINHPSSLALKEATTKAVDDTDLEFWLKRQADLANNFEHFYTLGGKLRLYSYFGITEDGHEIGITFESLLRIVWLDKILSNK